MLDNDSQPRGPERLSTPPESITDFPPSSQSPWSNLEPILPPSPTALPPRPRTPPPGWLPDSALLPAIEADPTQVALLKLASSQGNLQDVHQILSQYILTQTPDPATGRLMLSLFYESIKEAIAHNHPAILSYLFFMRIGKPALYVYSAIEARSADVFRVFLEYGWNINNPVERTMAPPLGYISDDHILTEWFLDHGADPNAACAWDLTAMSAAMSRASLRTIQMLFARGGSIEKGQLLHHAALRKGSDVLELVGMLLEMGASLNEIQYSNHPLSFQEQFPLALGTPLHYAVEEGNMDLVKFLLEKGADPSIQNTRGRTVLETAVFLHKSDIEDFFRQTAR